MPGEKWTTSGRHRLKARQNQSFAQRASLGRSAARSRVSRPAKPSTATRNHPCYNKRNKAGLTGTYSEWADPIARRAIAVPVVKPKTQEETEEEERKKGNFPPGTVLPSTRRIRQPYGTRYASQLSRPLPPVLASQLPQQPHPTLGAFQQHVQQRYYDAQHPQQLFYPPIPQQHYESPPLAAPVNPLPGNPRHAAMASHQGQAMHQYQPQHFSPTLRDGFVHGMVPQQAHGFAEGQPPGAGYPTHGSHIRDVGYAMSGPSAYEAMDLCATNELSYRERQEYYKSRSFETAWGDPNQHKSFSPPPVMTRAPRAFVHEPAHQPSAGIARFQGKSAPPPPTLDAQEPWEGNSIQNPWQMPEETIGIFDEPSSFPVADQGFAVNEMEQQPPFRRRPDLHGTGTLHQGLQSTDWSRSHNNGFDNGMNGFEREPTEPYHQKEGPPGSEFMGGPDTHRKEVAYGPYDYSTERNQPVQLSATQTNGVPTLQNRSKINTAKDNERVVLSNLTPEMRSEKQAAEVPASIRTSKDLPVHSFQAWKGDTNQVPRPLKRPSTTPARLSNPSKIASAKDAAQPIARDENKAPHRDEPVSPLSLASGTKPLGACLNVQFFKERVEVDITGRPVPKVGTQGPFQEGPGKPDLSGRDSPHSESLDGVDWMGKSSLWGG